MRDPMVLGHLRRSWRRRMLISYTSRPQSSGPRTGSQSASFGPKRPKNPWPGQKIVENKTWFMLPPCVRTVLFMEIVKIHRQRPVSTGDPIPDLHLGTRTNDFATKFSHSDTSLLRPFILCYISQIYANCNDASTVLTSSLMAHCQTILFLDRMVLKL